MFPNWIPVTEGFGYTLEINQCSYTGKWIAPYSTDTLTKARELTDPVKRFNAQANATANATLSYDYKNQIEHLLFRDANNNSLLTSQRATIKPNNDYYPYAVNASGVSTDATFTAGTTANNTISNAATCEVTIDWILKPVNSFGINCAYVKVNGTGEFDEAGTNLTVYFPQDNANNGVGKAGKDIVLTGNSPYKPEILPKGRPIVKSKDKIEIEYPFVEKTRVDLAKMRKLRGTINLYDILQWPAGTLLYEGSDVDSVISPLGTSGYKIVHHFTAKPIDWNLVPVQPANITSNTTANGVNVVRDLSYAWATIKPSANATTGNITVDWSGNKYDNYKNRIYAYGEHTTANSPYPLFYYGFDPLASTVSPSVNPAPF
jgi:hypothetical protein